ncbi:hypothetical protein K502DRAFT_325496 [Neoconidiobolus thromboides FSU 785]|nr:hypothetical protein K502DRAFT_325496 [Neoconidiobolus thromboides FSU 785]
MSYLPWIPIITSGWEDSDYRNLVTHQISEEQQGVRKNYILVSKESRKKIGAGCLTAIDYKESSCNLGLIIESAYFDQKFGTECIYQLSVIAFEELVLKRVTFETLNTNKPMIGWLEKVGKAKLINSNEKLVIGGVSYDMVKYEIDDVRWIQVSKQSLLDKLNRQ